MDKVNQAKATSDTGSKKRLASVSVRPATPLPYAAGGHKPAWYGWVHLSEALVMYLPGQYAGQVQDAAYIAHAANAYPKLVEALRALAAQVHAMPDTATGAHVNAAFLLRELGESERVSQRAD